MADNPATEKSARPAATDQRSPSHLAIVMDGNGRWAKRFGMPRVAGHRRGVETVRSIVRACADRQIEYLTLFAFSSENWRRPPTEVRLLMELLSSALQNEVSKLHDNNVRLRVIGDLTRFSNRIDKLIRAAESKTANNTGLTLTIAANYGGQWDITQACREIANRVKNGELAADDINESTIDGFISTAGMPAPDLFIRTGGEKRISNFLLWQMAYSELYFTDTLWPDFDESALDEALNWYATRQRRFGQTGDQVKSRHQVGNA